MKGTWIYSGQAKDDWGSMNNANVRLDFGDNRSTSYSLKAGWITINTELDLETQADGSWKGTYKQGSNTRTVTIEYKDGVVYFSDSYNAVEKYAMSKKVGGEVFNDTQAGTYVANGPFTDGSGNRLTGPLKLVVAKSGIVKYTLNDTNTPINAEIEMVKSATDENVFEGSYLDGFNMQTGVKIRFNADGSVEFLDDWYLANTYIKVTKQ